MIINNLEILLKGTKIGEDEQGNQYYIERSFFRQPKNRKLRRWVLYQGIPEPSKVPPQWHGWLHYTTDTPPISNDKHYSWQKPHLPNLTGTLLAYRPPGICHKDTREFQLYQAWKPE